jgi:FMN-dependent oxidoreductase (nitrilotriacetate monooxygenase family)
MPKSSTMHLAVDLSYAHTDLRWRMGDWDTFRFYGPEFYKEIARTASRGVFDMVFFGDAAETPENYGGNFRSAVETGFRWPKHDMMPMIPVMSEVASGLGFGLTMSTTYHHPFHVARLFASLDWVTGGRMGWNAVTSAYKNEAANWGFSKMPDPAERYRRAREHLQIVTDLWGSVEADAILLDREGERFGDPDKVHLLDHVGEHFSVRGPLPTMPSPQGRPIIIQAGQSPDGMDLAATYADMQFVSRRSLQAMAEHRETLDRLVEKHGRSPRDVGVWWAISFIIAESREAALAKRERIIEEIGPTYGMMALSAQFGVDFSALHPDMTLAEAGELVKSQHVHWGIFDDIIKANPPDMTIGGYASQRVIAEPRVVGSAVDIADQMEEMHEVTDRNGGFLLHPGFNVLSELREFVDLVVPELQRRGLVKTEYRGSTLRANLME